jgi:uncharacterized coiled-coil DUF342 family protein
VAPRVVLTEETAQDERSERDRLRTLETRFEALLERRRALLTDLRRLSTEQKTLYDRRQEPQVEVEKLNELHGQLGRKLSELRRARDLARAKVEEAVVRRRELLLTFDRGERERPEQIRKEIAELELRQQTRALSIDEENALIARLRRRSADLKTAEARVATVAAHERLRHEADEAITAARADVERLGEEMRKAREERDATMATMRETLATAGGLVAELREKGRVRAEVMHEVDRCSRELDAIDREGRELLARSRARRAEASRTVRQYAPKRRTPEEALASIAEAHLEELLKRGKVTL